MTVHEERNQAAARNTVALLASRAVISTLGWAGSIAIARVLSPEAFGQYSFVFGLLGIMSIFTDLGVGRVVLARLVDEDELDVPLVASAFIALRTVLGLVGYAIALAYVVLLGYPGDVVRATALAGLVVVVATPSHALTMLFQARLRMTVVAAAESLGQVVQLAVTLLIALVAPGLLLLVVPVIVNELVKIGVKLRGVSRGDAGPRPARQIELWRWRAMLVDAVPLTIGSALATLLYKIDVLLLSRLDTFDAVGLYSVGYKFADVLALVTTAVLGPALTLMLSAWPKDVDRFRGRARSTSLLLAFLGSLVVAGFWASARPLIQALYGDRFGAAATSSRLLVLGAVLSMLTQVGFTVLVATGRSRVYPWVGLVGLAVNVVLNLLLIPSRSYEGAALATVVTEGLVLTTMWLLVVRSVPAERLLPLGGLTAVAASTTGIVLLTELLDGVLWWPFLSAAGVVLAAGAGLALDLPGTRQGLEAARRTTGRWRR